MTDQNQEDFARSVNEQAINSSNLALKSLLLIHGGAAVALLAFVGSIAGNDGLEFSRLVSNLSRPLVFFGWGVAVTLSAMMFAYLTNYFTVGHAFAAQGSAEETRFGLLKAAAHVIAFLAALSSLVIFVVGIYSVRLAMLLVAA